MTDLPDPLVPSEVDLRDFPFMPLDVRRLRDSRLVSTRTGDEVTAAILLWAASWHQQPAASLPNDDMELSQLAGYGKGVREFKRIREGALHGLVLCSDGRLYHPVVAEKAADAWNRKLETEWKRSADRVRKENKERAARSEPEHGMPARPVLLSCSYANGIPFFTYHQSEGIPLEVVGGHKRKTRLKGQGQREGQGQGQGQGTPGSIEPSGSKTASPGALPAVGKTTAVWNAYSDAYNRKYGEPPIRNAKVNGLLANFVGRLPVDEAPQVAAFYVSHRRGLYATSRHCVDLLVRDAESLRMEWSTGRQGTETEARQGDRTQANANSFAPLLAEALHKEAGHGQ